MRTHPSLLISALVLTVALVATTCGDDTTTTGGSSSDGAGSDSDLLVGEWRLISGPVPDAAIEVSTVVIDADLTARGGTACNSWFADGQAIDGDRWVARNFGVTEMGCDPERHEAESGFLDALGQVESLVVTETNLYLSGSDPQVELVFARVLPPDDSELVGTIWVLDSIISGDAVSSTVANADPATLEFAADGSVTGSTGCNQIGADWTRNGDSLELSAGFATEIGCSPDVMAQESAVLDIFFAGQLTLEIDGPHLTLLDSSGNGLRYTAG